MNEIVVVVFPIFALIAVGYALVVFGVLPLSTGGVLSKFVFTLPLPTLMFRAIASSNVREHQPWLLWSAYFLCLFVVWIIGMIIVRYVFGRKGPVLTVAGFCAGFSNLGLLGIPLISGVFGEKGLVPVLLLMTVHLPTTMLVSSLLAEWYGRAEGENLNLGKALKRILMRLLSNPIIIGILLGGLWSVFGIPIPHLASLVIDKIVSITAPLALMAMGMGMKEFGLRGNVLPGLCLAFLKTVAFPMLLILVTWTILPLPVDVRAALILAAACPTGVNAYLLATHFNVGHAIAANTTSLSVLMTLVTLPFWISVATGHSDFLTHFLPG